MSTSPQNPKATPIINQSDAPPAWHWPIRFADTRAEGPANPGRRPAQYIPPVAGVRASQWRRGEPEHAGAQFAPIQPAARIRAAVSAWTNSDYDGATAVTKRLLRYWENQNSHSDRQTSFYFAQLDAVRTHIFLHEGAGRVPFVQELHAVNARHNHGMERMAHKMATGTGKTLVMAMLIAWQTANYMADPTSDRYTPYFLCLTPGITVRKRLESALQPRYDGDSEYEQFSVLPPDYEDALGYASVSVANWHLLEPPADPDALSGLAKRLIAGGMARSPRSETPRESADALIRRLTGAPSHARLFVINDEGHHCHQGDPLNSTRQATKWYQGLRKMHRTGRICRITDMSATPIYIAQQGQKQTPSLFDWIVSEYSLIDAMEAGLTKIPMVPTRAYRGAEDLRASKFRNIYDHTESKDRRFNPNPHQGNTLLKEALTALYQDYEALDDEWRRAEHHPVMAVVMDTIENAKKIFVYITEGLAQAPLLQNQPGVLPNTIIVHSRIEEKNDDQGLGTVTRSIRDLAALYRHHFEFAFHAKQSDTEVMREVLNTIGKPGQPGANVRCVVSVGMLTEGWDAKTVTHLLGFRKFGSSLLCEQVAGRTLRRVDQSKTAAGFYKPEYANILGVPFPQYEEADPDAVCPVCQASPCTCLPPETPEYLDVRCCADRQEYRVEWPHVVRMQRTAEAPRLHIQAKAEPADTFTIALPSAQTDIAESVFQHQRDIQTRIPGTRQQFLFTMAQAALQTLINEKRDALDDNLPQNLLFSQLLTVAKRYENAGRLVGPSNMRTWAHDSATIARASEWLLRNVEIQGRGNGSGPLLDAVPSPKNPWQSTDSHRDYKVTRNPQRVYETPSKTHISHAVCDSSWEIDVARALDRSRAVHRWARNSRLNWSIPYLLNGEPHAYYPDFLAVCPLPNKRELCLVIEVKGREWAHDPLKRRWAQEYWIPAVNRHPVYGADIGKIWQYLYLDSEINVVNADTLIEDCVTNL